MHSIPLWCSIFLLMTYNCSLALWCPLGFPGGSEGKESTCNVEDLIWSLDREDPLEEEMATHSSIPAWRIPMDGGAWQAAVHDEGGHSVITGTLWEEDKKVRGGRRFEDGGKRLEWCEGRGLEPRKAGTLQKLKRQGDTCRPAPPRPGLWFGLSTLSLSFLQLA